MTRELAVDVDRLRSEITTKYRQVAERPDAEQHFHTGRRALELVGYPAAVLDALPTGAVDAFAGVAHAFHFGLPAPGERAVDVGCGAGTDTLIAAGAVGASGAVVGVDMNEAMLARGRAAAAEAGFEHVEFREGIAEALPVPDGWADVVSSNGALSLVPDKATAFAEMFRILRPGGRLSLCDLCVEQPVPVEAQRDVDLWAA